MPLCQSRLRPARHARYRALYRHPLSRRERKDRVVRASRLPSLSSPVSDELDRLRNVIPARPLSAASDGKANTGIHSIYAGTDKDGSARTRPPRCAPVHPHFISQRQTGQRTLLIRMACITAYGEQTSPPPSNCASHNTSGASYRDRTAPGDARSKTEYTNEKVVNATIWPQRGYGNCKSGLTRTYTHTSSV